jgi:hypothetical protein
VPNAKDYTDAAGQEKIFVIGNAGAGKTSQIQTLPGKTFVYFFDPNGVQSIKGADVDYELYASDVDDIDLAVKTLKTGVGDTSRRKERIEPTTYPRWEEDFTQKLEDGFFKSYDNICFDSVTTFADAIMDRVLFLNGRLGKQPEQADWAAQINTISNVFRAVTGEQKLLYCTGHVEFKQNKEEGKRYNHLLLPGKTRVRLPLLFTNIWYAFADKNEKGATRWWLQTRPDKETPHMRSSIRELDEFEDVTIDFSQPLVGQGIGGLLERARAASQPQPVAREKRVANRK